MDIVEIKQEPKELIECFMPFENVGGDAPLEHSKDEGLFRGLDERLAIKVECDDEEQKIDFTVYECLQCGEIVDDAEDLVIHHKNHLGPQLSENTDSSRPITCKLAGDYHIRTDKRQFSCSVCEKKFSQVGHLNRHKKMHTGEALYPCEKCGKTFTRKCTLKRHLLSHTGERPFICEHCQKGFSQRHHLVKHLRTHTGERPYTCDLCNKSFGQRSTLERHQFTHTTEKPFCCDKCNRRFSRFGSLKRHQRMHTGLKPFQCDVCKKRFTRAYYLPIHMQIHEREGEYS